MKRRKNIAKLDDVMSQLAHERPLAAKYRDHKLVGNFEGSRECHIEPDWLLIYSLLGRDLIFERTGTHSDLFGK